MAAMVAGSMVPDLPLFVPTPWDYGLGHSLVGIVSVDLVTGTLLTTLWVLLIRDAAVDAAPRWVRDRAEIRSHRTGARYWLLVAPAVVIGAITHVVWDEFTHDGRWGARHVPWLAADHLGWAGFHWAQAVSTGAGLAFLLGYVAHDLTRRRASPTSARVPESSCGLGLIAGVGIVSAAVAGAPRLADGVHAALFAAAVTAIPAVAVTVVVAAAVWQVRSARTPRRST